MTLQEMKQAVQMGLDALGSDRAQDLPLACRKRIWRAFGEVGFDGDFADRKAPHQGRVELSILALERVLPIWERSWDDREPHKMVILTRRYMAYQLHPGKLFEFANRLTTRGQNTRGLDPLQLRGVYIVQAAAAVGFTALQDEWCDDSAETDDDIDSWDAAYLASWAWAGGARWEPRGRSPEATQRRGEFWRWYLDEAVWTAWAQSQRRARR